MSEEYVIFRANPNCCEKCSELDGQRFPVTQNIYDVSHPNCKCWFEMDGEEIPVKKMLDVAAAVFDYDLVADAVEEGANPADPRTSRRAGATFKTIKESYLPMLVLDDLERSEDEKEKRLRDEARKRKSNMSAKDNAEPVDARNCECAGCLEDQAVKDTLNEEVYTGFMYANQPEGEIPKGTVETTYDFGSTLVQISPVGDFFGTGPDGQPVPEHVTMDSLKRIVANATEEILVDFDHQSERTDDTRAAAWASELMVVENLGNLSGLYGRLKWTKEGRDAAMERKYRFLSPVWTLDDDNRPVKLISIALTNRPALKGISPIINREPTDEGSGENNEKKNVRTNKMDNEILKLVGISPLGEEVSDEEKQRVLETLGGWKEYVEKAEAEKKAVELRNAFDECVKEYEIEDRDALFDIYRENPELFAKTLNACGKKIKNACGGEDDGKDAPKNEEPAPEKPEETPAKEEPKEVIPVEALNSKPVEMPETARDKAMNLHGEEFFDYLRQHSEELRDC